MNDYTDRAGIDSRSNSALLRMEVIITNRLIPSAIRLFMVAEIMSQEPILTDGSSAAFTVRQEASVRKAIQQRQFI